MVNITIFQNGTVIGDIGKIIAYEGQFYSEPIHVTHPQFAGCQYFLDYSYNQTLFRDKINADGHVTLKVEKGGRLKLQFVAIDVVSGIPQFKSKFWEFIIHQDLKTEACHWPCSTNYIGTNHHRHVGHCNSHQMDCHTHDYRQYSPTNFDPYKAYFELKTDIENEHSIRFNALQDLYTQIDVIKNTLNILEVDTFVILDANTLLTDGIWYADKNSFNFPTIDNKYKITVDVFNNGNNIIQNVIELRTNTIWNRTGIKHNDIIKFNEWAPEIIRVISDDE